MTTGKKLMSYKITHVYLVQMKWEPIFFVSRLDLFKKIKRTIDANFGKNRYFSKLFSFI
jgi:hypothetical protein